MTLEPLDTELDLLTSEERAWYEAAEDGYDRAHDLEREADWFHYRDPDRANLLRSEATMLRYYARRVMRALPPI